MLRETRQQEERQDMKSIVLGILAHVDAGKTTLSEALLYLAGTIRKMGRVDNRDAFLDTYALERARGITIFSKQAALTWEGMPMTLLDTPGHVDFPRNGENAPGTGLCGSGYKRRGRSTEPYHNPVASAGKIQDTCIPLCQ